MEWHCRHLFTPKLVHQGDEAEAEVLLTQTQRLDELLGSLGGFGTTEWLRAIPEPGILPGGSTNPVAEFSCFRDHFQMGRAGLGTSCCRVQVGSDRHRGILVRQSIRKTGGQHRLSNYRHAGRR